MNKKILLFGLPILMMGLVVAGLLTYYGQIHQYVPVEQAVVLTCPDNSGCTETTGILLAPTKLLSEVYSVKNVDPLNSRDVQLVTRCSVINEEDVEPLECVTNEVTTSYVGVLKLTGKDDSWAETDNMKATLYYTIVGDVFNYKVDVIGDDLVNYVVVYYPDLDTDKTWNYANAVNLGLVVNGEWQVSDLATSLPAPGDYNTNPIEGDNYCENGVDGYEHCAGAKIWLMPSTDYTAMQSDGFWNPDAWLFETDLIVYSNTDTITLPAGGGFDFMVENTFIGTGDYYITTSVQPA